MSLLKSEKENLKNKFLTYFIDIEPSMNIKKAALIFNEHFDFNKEKLSKFLEKGISKYNNVPYHNAVHGLNTLYTGSIYLKMLCNYRIERNNKLLFLICCYLHDIGHPDLVTEFNCIFNIDLKNELFIIEEFINATNLINHDSILKEFLNKYYVIKNNIKEISMIELKILIKLSDLSTSYKDFKNFSVGSQNLKNEMSSLVQKYDQNKEDLFFIKKYAIPLAKYFSNIFIDFKFLYINGCENAKRLNTL
ncbi:calcium calmodulin-dependent 3 -cyclic nucleotide phosphodiesterase 1b [Vairimorpha apis BRL 01]|uniref:Calcium calmodulin-dependent 3-cyclic nucleotide phosphodiesterase 1b n=1 Tax=Vairimorpha apis BRL 01 TaxID=1037528 RepID=T0MK23_9MICR|nr:calcium calmodulin-dependent 3 -cyclic nucleotide phosphodiesterase 1b [Vairimorpha apis BRL 01]